MATSTVLRRSLLYVPASSSKMLAKSLNLASDNITYDLEDSVTPSAKAAARSALGAHLAGLSARPQSVSEVAVRINAVSTPWALDDLTAVASQPVVDAVVVPKVNSPSDLTFVAGVLAQTAGRPRPRPIRLLALIESARGITDLGAICAATPLLDGLIFAAEDFALDLSLTRTPSLTEFLYARCALATAARAHDLASTIDLVCTAYRGDGAADRLEAECRDGRGLGFTGKQCIHPAQVAAVNRLFGPDPAELEWAVRVAVADAKAAAAGRGAWTLDGKMIDAPVSARARRLVGFAERCGVDVEALREKWKGQEPE